MTCHTVTYILYSKEEGGGGKGERNGETGCWLAGWLAGWRVCGVC